MARCPGNSGPRGGFPVPLEVDPHGRLTSTIRGATFNSWFLPAATYVELTVLGASPALPNPGGASAGYLLQDGETSLLVDCGHGVVSVLRTVIEIRDLSSVIISHMHPDHYFDLVPLAYAYYFGGLAPVPLYLPPNGYGVLSAVESAVGLEEGFFSTIFDVHSYHPDEPLTVGNLEVRFAPTKHFVPAYAMRFQDGSGGKLFYSSDTAYSTAVVDLARGASVAVFESAVLSYQRESDREGHLDARTAGEMARQAEVGMLVVTHYPSASAEDLAQLAGDAFGKPVILAREGERIRI
jgi:ribonuclease BN (tRNA processing enzyme)